MAALGAKQLTRKGMYSLSTMDNVWFVRSNAYMNESGLSMKKFLAGERIGNCVIFVLYDDFETNLPKVKVQQFRKSESHGGLKSIQRELQSLQVACYKLGVGIGPKPQNASRDTMGAWILADFKQDEKHLLESAMEAIYKYVDIILSSDGNLGDCNKVNARVTKQLSAVEG